MTSEKFSNAAVLLLNKANEKDCFDTRKEFHERAQVYATLSVAAAQREWNELICVRFINDGDNFFER